MANVNIVFENKLLGENGIGPNKLYVEIIISKYNLYFIVFVKVSVTATVQVLLGRTVIRYSHRCVKVENCNKNYIGETDRAFRVRLQEHRQEVIQRDVCLHTKHQKIHSNRAKQVCSHRPRHLSQPRHRLGPRQVIDRESNRIDWWIRKATGCSPPGNNKTSP